MEEINNAEPAAKSSEPAKHAEESKQVVGTLDDTPDQHGITPEMVQDFIERYLSAEARPKVKSFKYRPVANLGEGYTTVRKVLEVRYTDERTGEEGAAVFVVKIPGGPIDGGEMSEMIRDLGLYEREVIMYAQVIEHFRNMVPDEEKVKLPFPRFVMGTFCKKYKGELLDDEDQPVKYKTVQREMLVMEKLEDFEVIDKRVGLSLEHMKILMPALARFHAIGYVLHKKHSEKADRLRQIGFSFPEGIAEQQPTMLRPLCTVLRHEGMTSEADGLKRLLIAERTEEAWKNAYNEDRDVVTIIHGDFWIGNMMFKFDTNPGGSRRPVEIKFLDMQLSQFGDLAHDLVYCLITSSRRETRRYIRRMLTWYVKAFRQQLEDLGHDADLIAPWLCVDRLLQMYAETFKLSFMQSLATMMVLHSSEEDVAEFMTATNPEAAKKVYQKMEEKWGNGGCSPRLTERVVELVEDLRQFGLL